MASRPRSAGPARLDATFAALADPTRRAMLARLADGELSVSDLARPFDVTPPAISHHVRVLEESGLVQRRRVGREHRLRLRPSPIRDATAWLRRHRAFWEGQLDALERFLEENP